MPIEDYMTFISDMNPDIMIVPLADNPFSRGRSNIAWLEGSYAGAEVLGPRWKEWEQPGICTYKDRNDFTEKLSGMMQGPNGSLGISEDYIAQNLMLDHVNLKRVQLIESVIKQ